MTTPLGLTLAMNLFLYIPRSLCSKRSRTFASDVERPTWKKQNQIKALKKCATQREIFHTLMIVSENSVTSNSQSNTLQDEEYLQITIQEGILGLASQTSIAWANNLRFIRLGNHVNNSHRVQI